jgi:hypothetical protein
MTTTMKQPAKRVTIPNEPLETTQRRLRAVQAAPAPSTKPNRKVVVAPRRRFVPARASRPWVVATTIVFLALFLLAGVHTMLIVGQLRLDAMRNGVSDEHVKVQELRLQLADLESPERVLAAANDLGLVSPDQVGYLRPGAVPGAEPMRVEAATVPTTAPPPTVPSRADTDDDTDTDDVEPADDEPADDVDNSGLTDGDTVVADGDA